MNPDNLSFLLVLSEGVLSFFSPCVIPLLPLYIGYLSSNAKTTLSNGQIIYDRKKVMLQTLCFVLGISFSFLLLGLTFTALGQALKQYRAQFQIVAGLLIILLGLFQLGVWQSRFLSRERKLPFRVDVGHMNAGVAFVLGFLFSFTWTPCIGPALSSILLLVSTSSGGYWYVLLYAIGFVVPFLLLGVFTAQVLNFLKDRKKVLPMVVKIGAVILLAMGAYSVYEGGRMLLAKQEQPADDDTQTEEIAYPIFTLPDVNGKMYSLRDYQGKVIIVNFFASWCGYCQEELETLREIASAGDEDVQIIGVLVVTTEQEEQIRAYLQEKNLPYPVLIDQGGMIASAYYVTGYPTTYVVSSAFELVGYVPGMVNREVLEQTIDNAKTR